MAKGGYGAQDRGAMDALYICAYCDGEIYPYDPIYAVCRHTLHTDCLTDFLKENGGYFNRAYELEPERMIGNGRNEE